MLNGIDRRKGFTSRRNAEAAKSGLHRIPLAATILALGDQGRWRRAEVGRVDQVHSTEGEEAMRAMSRLRAPVDAFFEKVTVNADNSRLRENRLKLLSEIRDAMHSVADFSKVEG